MAKMYVGNLENQEKIIEKLEDGSFKLSDDSLVSQGISEGGGNVFDFVINNNRHIGEFLYNVGCDYQGSDKDVLKKYSNFDSLSSSGLAFKIIKKSKILTELIYNSTSFKEMHNEKSKTIDLMSKNLEFLTLGNGNVDAGFIREVKSDELVTGDRLAQLVSFSAGSSSRINLVWLAFSYKNNLQFIAKSTIRSNLEKSYLSNSNLVYGDKKITLKGKIFKVRLVRGIGEDILSDAKQVYSDDSDLRKAAINSEWGKLMLPMWDELDSVLFEGLNDSKIYKWHVTYNNLDLGTTSKKPPYRNGTGFGCPGSFAQETVTISRFETPSDLVVGRNNLFEIEEQHERVQGNHREWRPVLELVN